MRKKVTRSFLIARSLATATVTALGAASAGSAELIFLNDGRASGVSADGSVVVGNLTDRAYAPHAFRWTEATGFENVGGIDRHPTQQVISAIDISNDGTVIVGTANNSVFSSGLTGNRAYRWTQIGGFQDLGSLGDNNSTAWGVSGDGNVVVGWSAVGGKAQAMRWTDATGMLGLGTLDGDETAAEAHAASLDGSVIVGLSNRSGTIPRAFSWMESLGMVQLANLNGGDRASAFDVSDNGSIIVGSAMDGSLARIVAVRWVDGVVGDLGSLDANERPSTAYGVSGNGMVIVGGAGSPGVPTAFRWTEAGGMQTVEQWVRDSGGTASDNTTFIARATNEDGSVVIGEAYPPGLHSDIFIARGNGTGGTAGGGAGAGGVGIITLTSLQQSLASSSTANLAVATNLGLLLNGAGSRPLDRRAPVERSIAWTGGDLGRDDHGTRDGEAALGEVGVGYNFGPVQLNGAVGVDGFHQNTQLGGSTSVRSVHAKFEAMGELYPIDVGGIWGTITATAIWGTADVKRNYLAGGLVDSSLGGTNVQGFGVRGRLQWENFIPNVSPYGELSHTRGCLGAYTETGGSFPAAFAALCDTATEARFGVDAKLPVTDTVSVIGTAEVVHRFEAAGSNVAGTVIGLGAFSLAPAPYQQNWLRVGLGVEVKFGEVRASVMGNLTTNGEAASAWLASSLAVTF